MKLWIGVAMGPQQAANPQWSGRIRQVLRDLNLTQAGLAERLGVSPATVSRWIQGKHEPTAETYIALGNLAPKPDGNYFWERAGINATGLPDASLHKVMSSLQVSLRDFKLVASRRTSRQLSDKGNAVAIPLLNITAYGDQIPPEENVTLSQVEVVDILLAPLAWCPHPESMISMHLAGDSMFPVIAPGALIFVDTASTDRDHLNQKLTVVAHRDMGFKVARLQRLSGSDLLVSANHKYRPLDISNASKWKVFGEVLWWVARDTESSPS
jgi:phage repressor protein C with HTH and peptisase S24 domain